MTNTSPVSNVFALGEGKFVINHGYIGEEAAALFIEPAPGAGQIGEDAGKSGLSKTSIAAGGIAITFANLSAYEVFCEQTEQVMRRIGTRRGMGPIDLPDDEPQKVIPTPPVNDEPAIHCEGCGATIKDGESSHLCGDGVFLCLQCAPTFGDLLEETEERIRGEDDDPSETACVAAWIARRLANGASLSDKAVEPPLTAAAPFMRGDGEAKSPIPPPHWQFRVGRMMQIADLIKELQDTEQKFGNTCVYITGCCWGAVALNRYDDDKKFFIAQKPDKCPRSVARPDPGCDECQGTGNRFAAQDAPGKNAS